VTLGDDVMSVVPDFRLAAQSMMIDEGTIKRPGAGTGTLDPVTGDWTPAAGTTIYTGRCRVRRPDAMQQQVVFGDISTTVSRYVVNLPSDSPLMAVGDVFTLTDSDDPEILDVPMRVVSVLGKSVLMYRQLGLEAIE
jgi:hypothetical protein